MKKYILMGILAVSSTALFTSCDDFLDDHRYPLTSQTNSPMFWSNEDNVKNEAAWLFNQMPGYGDFYFNTLSDDQVGRLFNGTTNNQNWLFTNVPASGGYWKTGYTILRHALSIMEGVEASSLDEKVKNNYIGIARLNRAYFTYQLVKRYGDVVWLDKVANVGDTEILYSPRQNRDEVMDKVLADLEFAVANITTQSAKEDWSRDLANAIMSEICLYEGTYCKYRTAEENGMAADKARADRYLQACVKASEAIMNGGYGLCDNYLDIYQTMSTAKFNSMPELIFGKLYVKDVLMHNTIAYTCSSTQICGISKDAFEAFLFLDGQPLAKTSMDKNDEGYMKSYEVDGTTIDYYYIGDVLANRDKRLSWLTDTVAYCKHMTWKRVNAGDMDATTGYGIRKYDNVDMELYNRMTIGQNYTSCPLYWLSYIYCNYAEAKAELGQLDAAAYNASIGKLYQRAGVDIDYAKFSTINDPANKIGVDNNIWEARRCRRCELMCDRDIRYWDLIRWHQLDKLDSGKYPNVMLGANMTAARIAADAELNFTEIDGKKYLNGALGVREYNARNYFYPMPEDQITLTKGAIKQNPGW